MFKWKDKTPKKLLQTISGTSSTEKEGRKKYFVADQILSEFLIISPCLMFEHEMFFSSSNGGGENVEVKAGC